MSVHVKDYDDVDDNQDVNDDNGDDINDHVNVRFPFSSVTYTLVFYFESPAYKYDSLVVDRNIVCKLHDHTKTPQPYLSPCRCYTASRLLDPASVALGIELYLTSLSSPLSLGHYARHPLQRNLSRHFFERASRIRYFPIFS